MRLTEKQKEFCREYVRNSGNGTQAYLHAYDSNSETAASIESSKLLKREEIIDYIATLNKPIEEQAINTAITEREKKRTFLWNMINNPATSDSDKLRAMDILNKMDSEYININKTIEDKPEISHLDTDTLIKLVKTG